MATIKISDLSVGDWVEIDHEDYGWQPAKINVCGDLGIGVYFKDIDPEEEYDCTLLQTRPIPITPEILEANGLLRHEVDADNPQRVVLSNYFMLARTYTDVDWWRVLIYDEEMPSEELFNGIVYYVHQLQHALRVAGVEKEIVMPNNR